MVLRALKYIEIDLAGKTFVNLPDINYLANRKIIGVVATTNVPMASGGAMADYSNLFLFLKGENGQDFVMSNYPLINLADDAHNGYIDEINRPLSICNSYIFNPLNRTGYVGLVIIYEDENIGYSLDKRQPAYDVIEVTLNNRLNNFFFNENKKLLKSKLINIRPSECSINEFGRVNSKEYFNRLFITLKQGQISFADRIPMSFFVQKNYFEKYNFGNVIFDFENSYIEASENLSLGSNDKYFDIVVEYFK